jgi:hypothetical protein
VGGEVAGGWDRLTWGPGGWYWYRYPVMGATVAGIVGGLRIGLALEWTLSRLATRLNRAADPPAPHRITQMPTSWEGSYFTGFSLRP